MIAFCYFVHFFLRARLLRGSLHNTREPSCSRSMRHTFLARLKNEAQYWEVFVRSAHPRLS
jgi:hypothetical protein